jgi:Protein of unknown function (DUF2950)
MNSKLMKTACSLIVLLAPAALVAQQKFSSPQEAAQKLFEAVQKNDASAIANILGRQEVASSGDAAQDKADLELFAEKYQQMHRVHRDATDSMILYVGAENWPFPIPLVSKGGSWQFDPDAGAEEILYRRIGENELTAIGNVRALAAQKGKAAPGALTESLAALQAGSPPVLVQGYYFRMPAAGLVIAYPAEYRSSGVMTFAVTTGGAIYEKDLGPKTAQVAGGMSTFHKDATWHQTAD